MSFDKMKVDELRQIADDFAVDINPRDNRQTIVAKLNESGVTWEYYQRQTAANEVEADLKKLTTEKPVFDEPAESFEANKVLMRMTRANPTFEVRGVKFTRDNPYALVREVDADFIMETYEGFRIASPKEVKEFYS